MVSLCPGAVPGSQGSPTKSVEHLNPMIPAGATFPAAVGAEQWRALASADPQTVSEAIDRRRAKPAKIVIGQREERDQIVLGDLARPSAEPGEFGIGQKPNRH